MLERTYSRLYYGVIKEFGLSANEVVFLTMVKELSKLSGCCFASKKTLAETMNVSEQTIYTMMRDLKERGLLEDVGPLIDCDPRSARKIKTTEEWDLFIEDINASYKEVKKK